MLNQFSRIELLIGPEDLKVLNDSKVLVFGVGGVGGNCIEALVRSGVGRVDIVDNDDISITNINRQVVALTSNVGHLKVEEMKKRALDINPNLKMNTFNCFYLPGNNEIHFEDYDYVIDCIDTVSAKLDIIEKCVKLNVPVISSCGTGNKMDPTKLEVTDIYKTSYDPLAKVLRKELKKRGIKKLKVVYSTEKAIVPDKELLKKHMECEETNKRSIPASCAFVPPVAGIIIAASTVKDLLEKN